MDARAYRAHRAKIVKLNPTKKYKNKSTNCLVLLLYGSRKGFALQKIFGIKEKQAVKSLLFVKNKKQDHRPCFDVVARPST